MNDALPNTALDRISDTYQAPTSQGEVESLMRELQHERVQSVNELIKDINELIDQRKLLSVEVMQDLEKIKMNINAFISSKKVMRDVNLAPSELIELKKKEVEVDLAKADEKISCFKDVLGLKQELRMHVHDVQDKVKRFGMLESLVDL